MVTLNEALAQLESTQVTPRDNAMANLQRVQSSGILGGSALNLGERFKYGFADDFGKQRLLVEAGYNPADIVTLNNGEYGIRTPQGIKPVDPKGFQLTDLGSDLAESIGKAIPTAGAVAGGLLGTIGAVATAGIATPVAVGGAMTLGAGGETIRQSIGQKLGVRNGYDAGEIALEGLLSGIGEGAGRLVASKLASAGARKMAVSELDNLVDATIKPTVLSKTDDMLGINNDFLTQKLLKGQAQVLDGSVSEDVLMRGSKKLQEALTQGQSRAGQNYKTALVKNFGDNYENTVKFDLQKLLPSVADDVAKIESKDLAGTNKQIVGQLKQLIDNTKNLQTASLSDIQTIGSALEGLKANTFVNGKATPLTRDLGKIQSKVLAVKNSNPAFAEINKQYAKEMNLLEGLQNTARLKLKQGEIVEGMRDPAKMLLRFKDDYGASKLAKLEKIEQQLRALGHNANFMEDITNGLLTDILKKQTRIPPTGFGVTPRGLAKQASSLIGNNAITRARMVSGIAKTNPDILNKEVGKYLGSSQALTNLFMQNMPNMRLPIPQPVKEVIGLSARVIKSKAGKRALVQAGMRQGKSLNAILGMEKGE